MSCGGGRQKRENQTHHQERFEQREPTCHPERIPVRRDEEHRCPPRVRVCPRASGTRMANRWVSAGVGRASARVSVRSTLVALSLMVLDECVEFLAIHRARGLTAASSRPCIRSRS